VAARVTATAVVAEEARGFSTAASREAPGVPEFQRGERLLDAAGPVDRQVDAPRAAVLVGVLLDRGPQPSGRTRRAATRPGDRPAPGGRAPRCGRAAAPCRRSWPGYRDVPAAAGRPAGPAPVSARPTAAAGQAERVSLCRSERHPAVAQRIIQDTGRGRVRAVVLAIILSWSAFTSLRHGD
jgi:hypothetical protein